MLSNVYNKEPTENEILAERIKGIIITVTDKTLCRDMCRILQEHVGLITFYEHLRGRRTGILTERSKKTTV